MHLDWKNGPKLKDISSFKLKPPIEHYLDNGIKVLQLSGGTQPVTKIDIIFKGGRFMECKRLTSRFVSSLLREGGIAYSTPSSIADELDYYGVNIRSSSNLDYNYLSFSCLNKHLEKTLPIIEDIIIHPSFSEKAIDRYKKKAITNLVMDLSKNEMVCYREFSSLIYGENHPYGYNTVKEDILNVNRNDIIKYYNKAFRADLCLIIVTGLPEKNTLELLNETLKGLPPGGKDVSFSEPNINLSKTGFNFPSDNKLQKAIKIGRRVCGRRHKDYPAFFLLNTVLGGYFGSRLMTIIREELGYTYNIYSTIDNLRFDSYFYISTEVNESFIEPTLYAIDSIIKELQAKPLAVKELNMVKNYINGNFMSLLDGPFLQGTLLRSMELEGLSLTGFESLYQKIQDVTAEDIQSVAQNYLKKKDLLTVIVG